MFESLNTALILMLNKLVALVFLSFTCNLVFASTPQLAAETATETWWYFKARLGNPKWKQSDFMVRTKDGKWAGKITTTDKINYKACMIGEKPGEYTSECIVFDSSLISDWAYNDNGIIRGAFMLRIKGVKKTDKAILEFTQSKLVIDETVGDDFIALSKWKGTGMQDSVSYYFLDSRYKGGYEGFYRYLGKSIVYPAFARKIGLQGYCYVSFVVEKNGSVSGTEVLQSIGGGCKEVSYTVIKDIPSFCEDEHAQKIKFTMPIKYMLK